MKSGKNNPNFKYGQCVEYRPEYNSWRAMKARCDDPKYRSYHRYGGRGITYCERWRDFGNFLNDMGRKPSRKHSLDRIDNNGNYKPGNCRWATQKEQCANTDKVKNARVTKEDLGRSVVSMALVYKRLREGWGKEKALSTPPDSPYRVLRERAIKTHNVCPVCGERCPRKRDKYCCMEHFRQRSKS